MFDYQIKSAAAIAREAIVGGITQMKDRLLQLEAENAQLVAQLEASKLQVAELRAENGRLRMRAEVGRSVCPWCGGEEEHQSDCELREGGQP